MRGRSLLPLLLVIAAALPLLLVVTDFVIVQGNRSLQTQVTQRQHVINEGMQLVRANGLLARHIAVAAVTTHDDRLRDLLSRNGITLKTQAPNSAGQ